MTVVSAHPINDHDTTHSVERHYTRGKLLERVLAALAGAGLDDERHHEPG